MPYPNDILSSRAVVKPGSYAIIPPEGLVNNVVPGLENCRVSIAISPKMGASFVQYIVTVPPGQGTSKPFGKEDGVETFIYIISGQGELNVGGKKYSAEQGAYIYSPPGMGLEFANTGNDNMCAMLYKQLFVPLPGADAPDVYFGNAEKMSFREYDGMSNVFIKDLLPTDIAFDMNMHILSFAPGGCHPFVETHVQEHGAYILAGEGCYYLNDNWTLIKKGDFVWFGPFTPQAAYGVGLQNFTYVYSKDCNRDASL